MIELNVPNVLTIAGIALVAFAAVKWGASMLGWSASWL